jgi:hypothetical protein
MVQFKIEKAVHTVINKFRYGSLVDKRTKSKHWVFAEEKLDETGARQIFLSLVI